MVRSVKRMNSLDIILPRSTKVLRPNTIVKALFELYMDCPPFVNAFCAKFYKNRKEKEASGLREVLLDELHALNFKGFPI